MPELTPLAKRVLQLKGDMSYEELSKDIERRTGKAISANGLQGLGSGDRKMGRQATISILAEYARKPQAWFYQDGDDSQVIQSWMHDGYDLMQNGQNPPPIVPKWDTLVPSEQAALNAYLTPTGDILIDLTRKQLLHILAIENARPNKENLDDLAHHARMIVADIRAYKK
jgi:hypothetical protein